MVSPADSASASILLWTWIAGNVGPIATIILTATAMARYLEKRSTEKIEASKKEILSNVDSKLDSMARDIAAMNATYDLIRKYIESDIRDLKGELTMLKAGSVPGSASNTTIAAAAASRHAENLKTRYELERLEELDREGEDLERQELEKAIRDRRRKWEERASNRDRDEKDRDQQDKDKNKDAHNDEDR